jgi:DNA invertase Pin-like site-specific DNA recombinase
MKEQSFVAYYRVSTQRQGQSGLGLDAQRNSVLSFIGDRPLIGEFKDIESGKNDYRPELLKAIEKTKETNSILVIAKLDRLSRNLNFITLLQSEKVKFICCDLPDANELTIHIFGALAEWERKRISDRTKEALKQLKKRGTKLGTPENLTQLAREKGSLKMQEKSRLNPNNIKAKKIIQLLNGNGMTLRAIAKELNESGFKTSTNSNFQPEQVRRLLNN